MNLCIREQGEKLWLYQVEDSVLMVEVRPLSQTSRPIGQVVLKRLISADQVIEHLCACETIWNQTSLNGAVALTDLEGMPDETE